ncbi:hypothetical protein SAMN06296241_1412 [Salinimicrobium sediminis]|uniref:TTHB210-like domain-containing protein n=1 Tax=Salinimicrobium sediminis TaxID=1343891 RepID=A0A285X524_9FLAO|nr:DUF5602 domain-containing protein [Salinimicrobium sediminis]SOC79874.1 hypothetical protein SAMN06296241_1412 [Salinimicrobium sediminis]
MKKTIFLLPPRSPFYLLPLFFLFLLAGCQQESLPEADGLTNSAAAKAANDEVRVNTFYGPAEPFNGGVVRTMVTMTRDGVPVEIGVRISEKALEDLPEDGRIISLDLPNQMQGLTFEHVDVNWNPHGHEPEVLYGAEHFDVHFYMVSEEYKMTITDPQKGVDYPDEVYQPFNYFPPPPQVPAQFQLVPNMGVHWTRADEPFPFTHTFIYGSYDNSFIFMEPMVTLEYLLEHADGTAFSIAQPDEFERSGYYPTTYKMYYDDKHKDYVISMGDMVWYD